MIPWLLYTLALATGVFALGWAIGGAAERERYEQAIDEAARLRDRTRIKIAALEAAAARAQKQARYWHDEFNRHARTDRAAPR